MGMNTNVCAFVPPDAEFKKKLNAYRSCVEAGIPVPKELDKFFGGEEPDDNGREIDDRELEKMGALTEYSADSREGYEIDITKLPKEVKIIRFYNSW
jgi:hypothetical protein